MKLSEIEFQALVTLSEREVRPLADQARMAIREQLRERGLLAGGAREERGTDQQATYLVRRSLAVTPQPGTEAQQDVSDDRAWCSSGSRHPGRDLRHPPR